MSTGDGTEIRLHWSRPVGLTLTIAHTDALTAEQIRTLAEVVDHIEYFRAVIVDPEIVEVEP